jgi:hypothetical protein
LLLLDSFNITQCLFDDISISEGLAYRSLAFGANFELNLTGTAARTRGVGIYPVVQTPNFNDVATVLEFDKQGIFFIFVTKKYLTNLLLVADTAFLGTLFSAETYTLMAALKFLRAR